MKENIFYSINPSSYYLSDSSVASKNNIRICLIPIVVNEVALELVSSWFMHTDDIGRRGKKSCPVKPHSGRCHA